MLDPRREDLLRASRVYVRALRRVRKWIHEGGDVDARQLKIDLEHARAEMERCAEELWLDDVELEDN